MRNFVRHSIIEAPVSELFSWHLRERAFERLTPPWLDVRVKGLPQRLEMGLKVELVARRFGIPMNMAFEVVEFESDKKFVDRQIKGPFAYWLHEHIFEKLSDGRSAMHDDIDFELPLALASEPFMGRYFDYDLLRMFRYRHEVLQKDLSGYMKNRKCPRMRVLVFGQPAHLTNPLLDYLATQGHCVSFAPNKNRTIDTHLESLEGCAQLLSRHEFDAVIKIFSSFAMNESPDALAAVLAKSKKPINVFVEAHDFDSREYSFISLEKHFEFLRSPSTRYVFARTGAVLTPAFGVLKEDPKWKGKTKNWIAVDDAVSAIEHCMLSEAISDHVDLTVPYAEGEAKKSNQLIDSGYEYRYSTLDAALKHVLGS
ncbi:MAG: hypothetical protein IT342_17475 [Candidatus Melainabacteria bacterium]|nr:hypothetical protein [Candidatus Melainabacteria bacterium]